MRPSLFAIRSLLLALALSAAASAQTVWIVDDDGGPGVDFTDLSLAVSTAAEGDVLLLRDGTYGEFALVGKSLSIVAEAGHTPLISEPDIGLGTGNSVVRIYSLAPGQEVYLRGLEIGGTYFQSFSRTPFMHLSDNQGEVWIEDCHVVSSLFVGFTGLLATDCVGVNVARCSLIAPLAAPDVPYGHGVDVSDTNLTVWDSVVEGGDGFGTFGLTGGGHGIKISGGELFASGCTISGGKGGNSSFEDFGGDGGDGLNVDGGALVRTRDCTLSGGGAGQGVVGPGNAGQPSNVLSGTLIPVIGTKRSLELSSPVRAGVDPVTETYTGLPGDLVYLLWSYSGQIPGFYLGLEHGSFVIDFTTLDGAAIGAIDATGTLELTIAPLSLVGLDVFNLACQAAFLDGGGGGFYISGPSLLTLVSSAF